MTRWQKIILIAIILVAVFFRFFKITEMPGGLFPDEAANGLDILSMEQGDLQPFYERGNGREALFFYLLWGSVKIFGFGPWQHHIVSALVGVLSTLVAFFAIRELLVAASSKKTQSYLITNLSLAATFFMATNAWHIVLSRTAFRANLIPLFTGLCVFFMLKSFNSKESKHKLLHALLFGISFGLGFYTYIAYRIMVPILVFAVAYPLVAELIHNHNLKIIKKWFAVFLLSVGGFLIAFAPLGHYFYTHPGSFIGRSGQVSVFNPDLNQGNLLGAIAEVAKESFLAYFTVGDLNFRHNISGLPFLSPLISPFFAIGLVIVIIKTVIYLFKPIKYKHYWVHMFTAAWFFGMLLPVITTAEGIPHGLRSIGTIPSVFLITVFGLYSLSSLVINNRAKYAAWVLAIIIAIFLPIQSFAAYFVKAYNSPENFYAFRSDLTNVSEYLKKSGRKEHTYLVLDKFSVQTPDYLTVVNPGNINDPRNRPYIQVDPEQVYKITELHRIFPGDTVVFTQSSIFDIKKFKLNNPNTKLIYEERNKFGQALLAVYVFK